MHDWKRRKCITLLGVPDPRLTLRPRRAVGRPTKYSEDLVERFLDCINEGMTVGAAEKQLHAVAKTALKKADRFWVRGPINRMRKIAREPNERHFDYWSRRASAHNEFANSRCRMPNINQGFTDIPGVDARTITHDAEFSDGLTLLIRFRNDIDSRVVDNIQTLVKEPSWGLLHAIYKRACTHVEGCFVLFSHGYHSCAEALCRTAIEASINLYFFSLGDTEEKLICYFKDYISTERDQNRKWLGSVAASKYSQEGKQHHYNSVAAKEDALRRYESFLAKAFDQMDRDYEKNSQIWPSLFNRFKLIGKEVDYRTVYAALCSQAHADAEDLLNEFVTKTSHLEWAYERQQRENRGFALFMVLVAMATLVESAAIYLAKYSLGANETLIPLLTEVEGVAHRVMR